MIDTNGTAPTEPWLLLQSGEGASAFNMALDEALMEASANLGHPVLRLYGWQEPAATFGYFQKYSEVAAMTPLRPLIRRPTGGGLVPHDADWTYSLVFPPAHSWYALRAVESYQRLHDWLRESFTPLGAVTSLAPARREELPGQCFAGAEQFDLLCDDRKIAGAAQRRNRAGLLIQGSVQPPAGLQRTTWESALCAAATHNWDVTWIPFAPDPKLAARASMLAAEKYSTPEYNHRR